MSDWADLRKGLPPGPWDDEPDRVAWTDPATGYPCVIRRGPSGAWCGYVGVPPGHPHHGNGYSEIDYEVVQVHGGLTYASECDDDPVDGICHVPAPGQPDDVWWFGFDCAHHTDVTPRSLAYAPPFPRAVYRNVDYVTAETAALAAQLAELDRR